MMKMMTFLRISLLLVIAVVFCSGFALIGKGYQVYKEAESQVGLSEKVQEIRSKDTFTSLEELKSLTGKRAIVVVGGGSMKRNGFLDKAVDYLKEAGMEVQLFENVEPDPSVDTVMRGAKAMAEFKPDWIVAMGGGSPIDAAKAMWVFYEYPDTSFEDLITPFSFPTLRTKAKFCAIPSTSGTATEVTAFSVITDYENGIKYPLADFNHTVMCDGMSAVWIDCHFLAVGFVSGNRFVNRSLICGKLIVDDRCVDTVNIMYLELIGQYTMRLIALAGN